MPTMHMTVDFEIVRCCSCGVEFGLLKYYDNERRKDGALFYCPNGHQQSYGDGEIGQLRRERDRLKQQAARLEEERMAAERREAAAKRETARVKKRASTGLCPCCNRTFQDVVRHMKQKHPEVAVLDPAVDPRPKKASA